MVALDEYYQLVASDLDLQRAPKLSTTVTWSGHMD